MHILALLCEARAIMKLGTLAGYSRSGWRGRCRRQAQHPGILEWALRLTRPGSVIVADNVVRGGRVLDPQPGDGSAAGVRRFAELLAAEPRLTSTMIQTVGSKGWDGLTISFVTS